MGWMTDPSPGVGWQLELSSVKMDGQVWHKPQVLPKVGAPGWSRGHLTFLSPTLPTLSSSSSKVQEQLVREHVSELRALTAGKRRGDMSPIFCF